MTMLEFKASLAIAKPVADLSLPLAALWWAGKGDWEKAHEIAQSESGAQAAWVHAYLHRVEGDLGNAGYWYRLACQPVAEGSVETEWERIVSTLLQGERA